MGSDFVIWPGTFRKWDFKSCTCPEPLSHYRVEGDSDENKALQLNDSTLTELKSLKIPAGKKKHLLLAMGFNFKVARDPQRPHVYGIPIDPSTPHLAVHESVVEEFQRLGFLVRLLTTYNPATGLYDGDNARDTYNKLTADSGNWVAMLCHTTC